MFSNAHDFMSFVKSHGEVMAVLESDREYELHTHDTEVVEKGTQEFIKTEGINEDEYQEALFPVEAVEHVYIHYEN